MLERYSLSPMKNIWTLTAQYERWWQVEIAFLEQLSEDGFIDQKLFKSASPKIKKITNQFKNAKAAEQLIAEFLAEEAITRHDVLAFVQVMARKLGEKELGRYFHLGITSSDILDSALALAIKDSSIILIKSIDELMSSLQQQAIKNKKLLTIGRSHGKWAEPTSFGLKFLSYAKELARNKKRLQLAFTDLAVGKMSGPVGNCSPYGVAFERKTLKRLGLKREEVATQVVARDRHAFLMQTLALTASGIERIALEIRHLQRSEVEEVAEPFAQGQKGSSAMPHKRNPILSENLCGLSRLLRSYMSPALENVPLWHERDMSHSSVERVILPDALILLHYALSKMNFIISGLVIYEKEITQRAEMAYQKGGAPSARLLHSLIVDKGLGRQEAYEHIQKLAFNQQIKAGKKMKAKDHLLFIDEIFDDCL